MLGFLIHWLGGNSALGADEVQKSGHLNGVPVKRVAVSENAEKLSRRSEIFEILRCLLSLFKGGALFFIGGGKQPAEIEAASVRLSEGTGRIVNGNGWLSINSEVVKSLPGHNCSGVKASPGEGGKKVGGVSGGVNIAPVLDSGSNNDLSCGSKLLAVEQLIEKGGETGLDISKEAALDRIVSDGMDFVHLLKNGPVDYDKIVCALDQLKVKFEKSNVSESPDFAEVIDKHAAQFDYAEGDIETLIYWGGVLDGVVRSGLDFGCDDDVYGVFLVRIFLHDVVEFFKQNQAQGEIYPECYMGNIEAGHPLRKALSNKGYFSTELSRPTRAQMLEISTRLENDDVDYS